MSPPTIADAPGVMRTEGWADYALLDSGDGRKLERYGPYRVIRPEPQAMWAPADPAAWESSDAVFDPTDEEDAGRWRFRAQPKESWPLGWGDVRFHGRFTAFSTTSMDCLILASVRSSARDSLDSDIIASYTPDVDGSRISG